MNCLTRSALILFSFSLCAGGVVVSQHSIEPTLDSIALDRDNFGTAYEKVAGGPQREPAFSDFESIIRRDKTVRSHRGRIEFGSVRMEGTTAVVQVLFFAPDGRMTPFFYTLTSKNNSWKIESVQRIWFVPRSHLLRGLRV
jgi:hypothetical protein